MQSAVDARRQGDGNPNSSVVAETMNLLANSSYGYQIMDRSQPTDGKTHLAINSKLFKKLDHVNNSLCEVELAKAQIDAVAIVFPLTCCVKRKQHDKRDPGLFKEKFRCTEIFCPGSKTYCCSDVTSIKFIFSSKGLNKPVLEQSGDGPLEMYRRVLNE